MGQQSHRDAMRSGVIEEADGGKLVTITKEAHERLLRAKETLDRLHAAGVDNWEGYSMAFEDDDDE